MKLNLAINTLWEMNMLSFDEALKIASTNSREGYIGFPPDPNYRLFKLCDDTFITFYLPNKTVSI